METCLTGNHPVQEFFSFTVSSLHLLHGQQVFPTAPMSEQQKNGGQQEMAAVPAGTLK